MKRLRCRSDGGRVEEGGIGEAGHDCNRGGGTTTTTTTTNYDVLVSDGGRRRNEMNIVGIGTPRGTTKKMPRVNK